MTAANPETDKPRRRQARGERRMAQLLDAAARVFAQVGYSAASTNAIAREAGVSPGTLYQFFPNKEAIGEALSERLVAEVREAHVSALSLDPTGLPLRDLLDQIIDPMVAFNVENPVCYALLHGPDTPMRPDTEREHDMLHTTMLGRVRALIGARAPQLDEKALNRCADVCFGSFKGVLQTLFEQEDEEERSALVTELKKMLFGYLLPIMGNEPPPTGPEPEAVPDPAPSPPSA